MHILYLSGWYPYPPANGSKLRVLNQLRELAGRHRVTLIVLSADRPATTPPELAALGRVVHVPGRPFRPRSLRALAGLLGPAPRVLVDTYQPLLARRIEEELRAHRYDLVVANEWGTAAYHEFFAAVPAIFDEAGLGAFESKVTAARSPLARLRHRLPLLKWRAYLRRLLPRFRICTVASEPEQDLLRRLVPGYDRIEILPNCVRLADYEDVPREPRPHELVFAGAPSYAANHDAAAWFLRGVFPRIRREVPEAHLTITGEAGSRPLPRVDGVTLTGRVADVRPVVASATVSVAPIRQGGGTRLKILEAMCLGTAVVSTVKGAEGLDLTSGEHLLIADTAEGFARATVRLLREPALRARLIEAGRRRVETTYDSGTVGRRLGELVERAATPDA
jgi:glycosyltransferase involved in cell wall biosynthesis